MHLCKLFFIFIVHLNIYIIKRFYFMNFNVAIRVGAILLAMLQPIIILLVCGEIISFSASWNTVLQPLYIITNSITSYFLFSVNRWKLPALLLLILTAFSVQYSPNFHDSVAVLFFVSCIPGLYAINRLRHYLWLFLTSIPILLSFGLFWFETCAVWVLCFYHLNLMFETIKVKS